MSRARQYRQAGWWPETSRHDHYAQVRLRRAEATAVADNRSRRLTYAALWDAAAETAALLERPGPAAGTGVVIFLPNWTEWVVAYVAAVMTDAVPIALPVTMDEEALAHVLQVTGARVVIAPERFRGRETGDIAVSATRRAGAGWDALLVDETGRWRWSNGASAPSGTRAGSENRGPLAGVHALLCTSSTTGLPKSVMHSQDTLGALNITIAERYRMSQDTAIFMSSPLGHSVGFIHGVCLALHLGAALILQDIWDPDQAVRMVAEERCFFTAAATPFLKDLVDADVQGGTTKLASMGVFLCGGAPVPPTLIERAKQEMPRTFVSNLWGMTEGGVTCCPPGAPSEKVRTTAGCPLPGLELVVLAPTAERLGEGQAGELAMRGPGVFVGYWGQEDLYRSLLVDGGFFRTGDQAVLDNDGYLTITGRLKDFIIRGGVNIPPIPVEAALASHPAVQNVAVVGLPDERLGERICACVVPAGEPPTLEALITWAERQGLPTRLWPEALRVLEVMPATPSGKIRKHELRAMLEQEPSG